MSSKFNYDEFRRQLKAPQLTPDIIDDFVTWLTKHGYDLYSFQISDVKFKRQMFSKYWRQTSSDQQQFKMDFPD